MCLTSSPSRASSRQTSTVRWQVIGSFSAHIKQGVIFAAPSFCDPALLERPMLADRCSENNVPYISFKYAENSGQMQPIREQAGTFADSIKLWS